MSIYIFNLTYTIPSVYPEMESFDRLTNCDLQTEIPSQAVGITPKLFFSPGLSYGW